VTETAFGVGDPLPEIRGETQNGPLDLGSFRGKRLVVLWTYPKDDTPGCTVEAQEFTALAADFDAAGAEVVGLSRDSVDDHCRFAEKYALNCHLLADPDGAVLALLGVEREPGGMAKRTTFVIDKDGIIRRVFENVSARGHADAVLTAVKEL
jgi:peroxiredoxin Q/BCP